MATLHLFILVTFAGLALAGPLDRDSTCKCGCDCPCSLFGQKLSFTPGKSYIYSYKGHSEVVLDGVNPQATSSLDWEAEVALSWLSECKVAIGISKPVVNGYSGDHILDELLASKSMVATMKDGVVSDVIPDQNDHPTGLNLKKGIISSIQNVLPELTSSIVNQNFVENDVLGRCPTTYTVKDLLVSWKVNKTKNHKHCSRQYESAGESPITSWWMRAPRMPLYKSRSECEQLIRKHDNITTMVQCRDENVIKAVSPKKLTAVQETTLTLKKVVNGNVVPEVQSGGHKTDLVFEVLPQPVTKEVVPKIEKLLRQLAASTEKYVSREAASYLAKMTGLLYRLPEDSFRTILQNIRNRRYSHNPKRLEDLFLDAMSFIGNAGAVQVMVDEVTSGKINSGRTAMYTIALHLLQKPCIHSVEAVIPLFSPEHTKHVFPSMALAAGSLVRKYCRSHHHCLQDAPVRSILEKLTSVIESSCSSASDSQEKTKVLVALKTIGNIANITKTVERTVLSCAQSKQVDVYVRVAAAQAYRHASCHDLPTSQLMELALNPSENTEVRIASHMAAIRCASYEQVEKLVSQVSREANTQVRSFILSHLHNLQRSDAPYLRGIRYNLTSFIIPTDYEQDLRKYSFNSDYSYYSPTLGIGAGIETSVIYTPGSYLPRQLQTNITADLFNNVINIGEFAVRSEDLETLTDALFGPHGYISNTPWQKIMEDLLNQGSEFEKKLGRALSGEKLNKGSLNALLKVINSERRESRAPELDAFARIFGQEVLFASVSPDFDKNEIGKWLKQLMQFVTELMVEASSLTADSARALQVNFEYFVPTVQGIPLQLKMVGTGVLALQIKSDITRQESVIHSAPSLSFAINSFVGYSFGVKTGLRTRVEALTVSDHSLQVNIKEQKVEAVLDIPQNMSLFNATGHCYMMNKMPGREDQRTAPGKIYPVSHMRKCSSNVVAASTGIKLCVELSAPDIIKTDMFPLGDYMALLTLEKNDPRKQLLKATGRFKKEENSNGINMKLELPGSSTPVKGEMGIEYNNEMSLHSWKLFGRGPNSPRKIIQIDFKNIKTPQGQLLNFIIFYGKGEKVSTSDQVLVLHLHRGRTAEEAEVKLDLKTKKIVSRYIQADIEVDIATKQTKSSRYLTREVDIRKFEISFVLPNALNTTSFIRKGQQAKGSSHLQYYVHSLTRTHSWEMLRINGTIDSEGEIFRRNHESRLNFSVKASNHCFHCESAFVWTREIKRVLLSVKNESAPHYCFLANASLSKEPSSSVYSTMAELQIPSIMPVYRLEGSVEEKGSHEYHLNLFAKKENRPVYQIKGPLNIEMSPRKLKQESEIMFKHLSLNQEYTLSSELLLSPQKMGTKVAMTANGAPAFTVEGEIKAEGNTLSSGASFAIPRVVDAKLKAEKTSSMLQLMLNGYIKPNTPESQRMKAYSLLDFNQKLIKATYDYDLNKNRKNMKLHAMYDYNVERMFASVKGDVQTPESSYIYSTEGILGFIAEERSHTNAVKVLLKKAEMQEEMLLIDCDCQCNSHSSPDSVTLKVLVKYSPESAAEHTFKFDSNFNLEKRNAPYQMALKGSAKLNSQMSKEVTLSIDSKIDSQERRQKVHNRIELSGSEHRKPFCKAHLEFENVPESFSGKMLLSLGSSSDFNINGEIAMTKPENKAIGDGSLDLNIKIPKKELYTLKASKKSHDAEIYLSKAGSKILAFEQSCPEEGRWQAKLVTPSRVAEAHSKYSSDSASLALYPNRNENEAKYELTGHYRRSSSISGSRLDTGAQFKYPSSEKGLGVWTDVAIGDSSSHGTIEFDVFSDPKEKVVVDVQMTKLSEHSYKIKADVKIPAHNFVPQIDLNVTLSRDLKNLAMLVKKSPSSQPTLESVLSFVRSTDRDSSFYARLRTPSDRYELISVLQLHELSQCRGVSVNGTLVSRRHGSYDFASAVCAPGYIEFGVKNVSDGKMFVAKLGMKNPASIKVALDLVYNSSQAITVESARKVETTLNLYGRHEYVPKIPMLLVGAKLWSPKLVSLDVQYNVSGIKEYEESILKPSLRGAKKFSEELLKQIPKELDINLPDISPSLITELKELKEKLGSELEFVLQEMGLHLPSWEDFENNIKEFYSKTLQMYKNLVDKIEDLLKKYLCIELADIQESLRTYERNTKKWLQQVIAELQNILSQGKAAMKEIPTLKLAVEWLEESSIFDWLKEKIEWLKEKLDTEWNAVKQFISRWYDAIKDEIKAIRDFIINNTFIKKIIKWIESWLSTSDNDEDSILFGSLLSKFYSFYMNETMGLLRLQVPLRRPVSSLSAALSSVGIPMPSKKSLLYAESSSSIVQSLIRPFSASAWIEEKTLTTFDGLVVPMCYSECEILMASVFGDAVTATKSNPKKTELRVTLQSGKMFRMFLDEMKPPLVPVLKNATKLTLPGAKITKISNYEIKVELKGLILHAQRDTLVVNAKSVAFSKVNGLLGNHDSEKGNDAPEGTEVHYLPRSSQGEHHLSSKGTRELFERYRVDKSCVIRRA